MTSNELTKLKLDGQLSGEETRELLHACEDLALPFVIDLSDLQFADDEGVKALLDLKAQGARLVGARPYVSMLLEEEAGG